MNIPAMERVMQLTLGEILPHIRLLLQMRGRFSYSKENFKFGSELLAIILN